MLSSVLAQQILASARGALSTLTTCPWYLPAVTHIKYWHRPAYTHANLDPEACIHTWNSTRFKGVKDRLALQCPERETAISEELQLNLHIEGVVAVVYFT